MAASRLTTTATRKASKDVISCLSPSQNQQRRSLFGFGRKTKPANKPPSPPPRPILSQNNLFHPLSSSPIPSLREKSERIKKQAFCPVSLVKYGQRKHVAYDCPTCGWPTHASRQMWEEDPEKEKYWARLREANEDEHDLRSGRLIKEFELPGDQPYEEAVSLANWDMFFYTRGFPSIDNDRARRHVSKLLSYPITMGSILHENSPYTLRNQRVTPEGLRSLVALRQTLHPPLGAKPKNLRPQSPFRIFVLGARAESSLPGGVYQQLSFLFPSVPLHVFFIGPEVALSSSTSASTPQPPPSAPSTTQDLGFYGVPHRTQILSEKLTLTSLRAPYEELHPLLGPFDPYTDVFFSFSPGFGFPTITPGGTDPTDPTNPPPPQLATNWHSSILSVLETKCSLFLTGFSPADLERDILALDQVEGVKGEYDWILTPGENLFGSGRWEVAEFDPRVAVKTNAFVYGIRGKRYDVEDVEGKGPREEGIVPV